MHRELGSQPHFSKLWCTPSLLTLCSIDTCSSLKGKKAACVLPCSISLQWLASTSISQAALRLGKKQPIHCACPQQAGVMKIKPGNSAKAKKTCWTMQSLPLEHNPCRFCLSTVASANTVIVWNDFLLETFSCQAEHVSLPLTVWEFPKHQVRAMWVQAQHSYSTQLQQLQHRGGAAHSAVGRHCAGGAVCFLPALHLS